MLNFIVSWDCCDQGPISFVDSCLFYSNILSFGAVLPHKKSILSKADLIQKYDLLFSFENFFDVLSKFCMQLWKIKFDMIWHHFSHPYNFSFDIASLVNTLQLLWSDHFIWVDAMKQYCTLSQCLASPLHQCCLRCKKVEMLWAELSWYLFPMPKVNDVRCLKLSY